MNLLALDETRGVLFSPVLLPLDLSGVVQLGVALSTFSNNDYTDALPVEVPASEGTDTAQTTRTKVQSMGSRLGEIRRLRPVDR